MYEKIHIVAPPSGKIRVVQQISFNFGHKQCKEKEVTVKHIYSDRILHFYTSSFAFYSHSTNIPQVL